MANQLIKFVAKDFAVQRKTLKTYILIGLLLAVTFSITSRDQHSMAVAVIAFPVIYGFTNKALYEDEKNNTLRFLVSLPLKRDIIVYSRYISVVLMSTVVTVLLFILNYILVKIGIWKSEGLKDYLIIISTIYIFFIMISIYLPMSFKIGYIKAAGINRFIFIGLIALGGIIGIAIGGLTKSSSPEFLRRLDEVLSHLDFTAAAICSGLLILAVYFLSMCLSVRLFRKRELF